MSGHSKFANIKHKKEKNDAAKGKIFTIIGREIAVAVKEGGPDPANNFKLAQVIAKAKANNMPNDTIDRGIKKAAGEGGNVNYKYVTYEGYGPNGAAVIVDTLTDNVNRTVAEVRSAFNKNGGKIGVSGAVAFMFEATALFGFNGNSADEILEGLMEADVDVRDVEEEDGEITVYADQDQFHAVQTALNAMGINEFEVAELTMLPTSTVSLEGDALTKFLKLIDVLEDLDDVQQVHHNVDLPEEEE